jgi:BirA family transcriptional regulator, biotin operon repressor / biotin---[acetyl-CoA-carboxylase] ligase
MHRIETVAETGSTNDDLLARAGVGAPEGLWLRAERQTGGRGRQGRPWVSPPGNLYASTLVRLRPTDPAASTLALVAAVALHDALAVGRVKISIKWPNDLMAGQAKLAGILLERSADAVIIGFGANLAHHPDGLDRPVTSLKALTGTTPEAGAFAEQLAETFARRLGEWRRGLSAIRNAWLAAGHPVGTMLSTPEGKGLFDGLDDSGALRLRLGDGTIRTIHAGDVFLI